MSPQSSAESKAAPIQRAGVEVLLVGPADSPLLTALDASLELDGWPTCRLANASALEDRLGFGGKAVVVLRTPTADAALDVLPQLAPKSHSALVIVVVDSAEPGEYYCLMQAGATQYFEINEDPARILQGVEWAAHVLAP